MRFNIMVTETFTKSWDVEAETEEEALSFIEKECNDGIYDCVDNPDSFERCFDVRR